MKKRRKVFGVGYHKTGTTSLANALYTLGFNVTGYFGTRDADVARGIYELAYVLADRFDAAQDMPWPALFKELDRRYPDSKFILTIRQEEQWIKSVVRHFKRHSISTHQWVYGVKTAQGNEEVYLSRYREHNRAVLDYFKDRPNDLLVMDITNGDGWEKLCPFLDLDIPPFEFPMQNITETGLDQFVARVLRYLARNLNRYAGVLSEIQLESGVSSAFVRDIVHYHYARFDDIWEAIHQLPDAQFFEVPCPAGSSVYELLKTQISEENYWLNRMANGSNSAGNQAVVSACSTKEDLHRLWKDRRLFLRQKVANLSDSACNELVAHSKIRVWEVFFHLVNFGSRQYAHLVDALMNFGCEIKPETFVSFFHPNESGELQSARETEHVAI